MAGSRRLLAALPLIIALIYLARENVGTASDNRAYAVPTFSRAR